MADTNINKTPEEMKKDEAMKREQGQQGQPGFDKNRQPEKGGTDKEREEKSAIGGGQTGQSGQQPDKSRSEPTNR